MHGNMSDFPKFGYNTEYQSDSVPANYKSAQCVHQESRDALILLENFLENTLKKQKAGKMDTKEWQISTFCMEKIEIR